MAKPDRIKGVKRYKHPVSGIWYCYHRKTGKRIVNDWRTAAFYAEVAALDAAVKAAEPLPASLGLLIDEYRKSPAWAPLAPKTRLGYERIFMLLKKIWPMPVKEITRPAIFELRDKWMFPKHGRWTANYTVTVMALLLQYAKDHKFGGLEHNPLVEKVKRIRAPKGHVARNRPWSGEECRVVIERAPVHLRLPIALAMFAGFRKADVLTMTKAAVKDGMIAVRTSKRGVEVSIPVHPALREAMDAHEAKLRERDKPGKPPKPRNEVQLCLNSHGERWSESGYNSSFGKFIATLEAEGKVAKGLTMHGLRHTLGTRLRESGATREQIMKILGQKSPAMADHYAEGAAMDEETMGRVYDLDVRRDKQ